MEAVEVVVEGVVEVEALVMDLGMDPVMVLGLDTAKVVHKVAVLEAVEVVVEGVVEVEALVMDLGMDPVLDMVQDPVVGVEIKRA
jgi:hypothetical protein